jgi:hypothetical protein
VLPFKTFAHSFDATVAGFVLRQLFLAEGVSEYLIFGAYYGVAQDIVDPIFVIFRHVFSRLSLEMRRDH